jgi:hypothetical protein
MRRVAAEVVLVSLGSIAAGWLIGIAQHFIALRVPSCGLSLAGDCRLGGSEFYLAFWEGGLVGAAFGLPTGLAVWYGMLRRHSTVSQVRTIMLGSLIGGCAIGAVIPVLSAFVTPFLTLAVAALVSYRRAPIT